MNVVNSIAAFLKSIIPCQNIFQRYGDKRIKMTWMKLIPWNSKKREPIIPKLLISYLVTSYQNMSFSVFNVKRHRKYLLYLISVFYKWIGKILIKFLHSNNVRSFPCEKMMYLSCNVPPLSHRNWTVPEWL